MQKKNIILIFLLIVNLKSENKEKNNYINHILNLSSLGISSFALWMTYKEYLKKSSKNDIKNKSDFKKYYYDIKFEELINSKNIKNLFSPIINYLNNYKDFKKMGINGTRGVFIYGPKGTGKTSYIYALANDLGINIFNISKSAMKIFDLEDYLNEQFYIALKNAPSIILIDDIQKNDNLDDVFKIISDMLNLKDSGVVFALTANNIDNIPPELLRSGKFDLQIKINLPNSDEIINFIESKLKKNKFNLISKDIIENYMPLLRGFSYADLDKFLDILFEKIYLKRNSGINEDDFEDALKKIKKQKANTGKFKPIYPNEKITLDDLGGMTFIKPQINEIVKYLSDNEVRKNYKEKNIMPPKGILLYGPSGTGKTYIARIISNLVKIPIFTINASDLISKWQGESEQNVKELFSVVRENAPAILFIDEIDSILPLRRLDSDSQRDSVVNLFLSEMDGFSENTINENDLNNYVLVIGTTNRKELIDPAALRPGRIEKHILVPYPKKEAREEIIQIYIKKHDIKLSKNIKIEYLTKKLDGLSPASISSYFNLLAKYLAKNKNKEADIIDIDEVYQDMQYGEKLDYCPSEEDIEFTSWHEAGHAIMLLTSENSPYIFDILTIVPRGGALGYLSFRNAKNDNENMTKDEFLADIDITLGGRAVEDLFFDAPQTGAVSDLGKATEIARNMIGIYGMGNKLITQSDLNKKDLTDEAGRIIQERYKKVKEVIASHKEIMKDIVFQLKKKKTLYLNDMEAIFKKHGKAIAKRKKVRLKI